MTITLFGIPNCDQVKNARVWLDTHQISYVFHDFKKAGIDVAIIHGWLEHLPWDSLINRKGTTWRKLDEARRAQIIDQTSAIALMLEQTSIIKRPVLQGVQGAQEGVAGQPQRVHVGFTQANYESLFSV